MLRLFEMTFFTLFVLIVVQSICNFGKVHGGFGNMWNQFEQELKTTAQLMLYRSTNQMQQEVQHYIKSLE